MPSSRTIGEHGQPAVPLDGEAMSGTGRGEPVYRRCGKCRARVAPRARRCECGSESLSWYFTADLPARGRGRRQVRRGGFETKELAREARGQVIRDAAAQALGAKPAFPDLDRPLGDYLSGTWLEQIKPPYLEETTYIEHARKIRLHVLRYEIAQTALGALSADQLDRHYQTLLQSGRADGRGGLSPKTVREIHGILHKALEDAVKALRVPTNPANGTHPPSERMANANRDLTRRVWTAQELRRFLDFVEQDDLYALWMLAANTGMRRSELLGAQWQDVNLDLGRISIRRRLACVDGVPRLSVPKSKRSRRTIDLDGRTVAALARLREGQEELERDFGGPYWEWGFVNAQPDGHWLNPDVVTSRFAQLVLEAGLPRIPLKNLRHTHATLLLASGANIKVVSERLGHFSEAFTLQTYADVLPNMQGEAVKQFSGLLWGHDDAEPPSLAAGVNAAAERVLVSSGSAAL